MQIPTDNFIPILISTVAAGCSTRMEEVGRCYANLTCTHPKWFSHWMDKGCFKPNETCKAKLCHCSLFLNLNFVTGPAGCKHWCVIKNMLSYKSHPCCRRLQHFLLPISSSWSFVSWKPIVVTKRWDSNFKGNSYEIHTCRTQNCLFKSFPWLIPHSLLQFPFKTSQYITF